MKKSTFTKQAWVYLIGCAFIVTSCSESSKESEKSETTEITMGFSKLSAESTGIDFTNTVTETDTFNYFRFEYIYNGGGVAVGDINNDGLEDVYFTGNQVSDKLYLNKGDMKFEDITKSAIGPTAQIGWHTGVVMQDVNLDGWVDIYVSRSGLNDDPELLANLLYINNGDNTFSEKAKEYGVDVQRPTTQSAFFDMDNDGDLDLYVMNHPYNSGNGNEPKKTVQEVNQMIAKGSPFSDVLLENKEGKYVDVTKSSGINNHAFGLGLAVGDVNNDGYADLYISNDYMAPDYLYINQGDGTFEDQLVSSMQHISNYSMGNDMADFNNDGLLDIISVDMVSEDHIRSKKNMGGMSTKKFWDVVNSGYHYQYMFNCLQMNNGNGTFSDIAQLAGVSKTDWSWAPLFADFNNDGYKDLYITNGYRRDTRDNDYVRGFNRGNKEVNTFQDELELMPETKVENYMYLNNGDLSFTKVTKDWSLDELVNSNGAAFADLDNDGDLDIILNNMEDEAYILKNEQSGNAYLKLVVEDANSEGVKITLNTSEGKQYQEFRSVRGYQSSVSHEIHFGLGQLSSIDEIWIEWPDGKVQILNNIQANQTLKLSHKEASNQNLPSSEKGKYFEVANNLTHVHREIPVNDFEIEVLLPNKMSQMGPFMSSGDVNGDGKEDIYISGSRYFSGSLYLGAANNKFVEQPGPWNSQKEREELGSVMFDADNDGDLDLYVVSGSNEYDFRSEKLKDQLYINDGSGKFTNKSSTLLPDMICSGQRVVAGDYDNDGDQDLFVGGRQTPGYYPFPPRSYLLQNVGGKFIDATPNSADLMGPGLITDVQFVDLDDDKDLDLVMVGEWMAPSFFRNDAGVFVNATANYGTHDETGWWSSLEIADVNGDGKNDFIFGNLGFNNKFHPDKDHPLEIYTRDFDKNGTYDIVLGKYQDGTCYPVRGRQCSSEQMPFIENKFPTYGSFAISSIEKIYGKDELDSALHYSATQFGSMILLSDGGRYKKKILPNEAQLGPLNAIEVKDLNKDGNLDILAVGNNFAAEVETVRYDGGRGVLLLGDGKGNFTPISPFESGFFCNQDSKDMLILDNYVVVSNNSANVVIYKILF